MWVVPLALWWVGQNRRFKCLAQPLSALNQQLQPQNLLLALWPCDTRVFKTGQNLYLHAFSLLLPLPQLQTLLPPTYFLSKSSPLLTVQLQPHLLQEALPHCFITVRYSLALIRSSFYPACQAQGWHEGRGSSTQGTSLDLSPGA